MNDKLVAATRKSGLREDRPVYPDTNGQMYLATDTLEAFIGIGQSWVFAGSSPSVPDPVNEGGMTGEHFTVGVEILPVAPYSARIGSPQLKFAAIYAGELYIDNIVSRQTAAQIGGRILVGLAATTLTRDVLVGDTSIYIKEENAFSVNSVLYLEGDGAFEFIRVDSIASSTQLISNNGFETAGAGGADIWLNWTENASDGALANETVFIYEGSDACKPTAGPNFATYVSQDISVTSSKEYKLYLWTRGDGTNSGRLRVWDTDNAQDIVPMRSLNAASTTYAQRTAYFTIPVNCTTVTIYLYCPGTNGGIAYFDAVRMTPAEQKLTVTRNLDGSGQNDWRAGASIFSTGSAAGDGFIDMRAGQPLGTDPSISYGPAIVGNVRNSTTYNDWTEHWAIGNLNGEYGYVSDTYGVGLGKYGSDHVVIDSTNGIRFRDSSNSVVGQLSASAWTIGRTNNTNITIDPTNGIRFRDSSGNIVGQLTSAVWTLGNTTTDHVRIASTGVQLKDSSTVKIDAQTDGDIFIGSNVASPGTTYFSIFANAQTYNTESMGAGDMLIGDNSTSKANIFWDFSAGTLLFRGGKTTQVEIDTSGRLVAGGGAIALAANGLTIMTTGTGDVDEKQIAFADTITRTNRHSRIEAYTSGSTGHFLKIVTDTYLGAPVGIRLVATGEIQFSSGGTFGYIFVPLTSALGSISWDGDSRSDTSKTLIDLSAVFGVPAGVKAVLVRTMIRDSASVSTASNYLLLSPESGAASGPYWNRCSGVPNNYWHEVLAPCPCDSNGDIYYEIDASGASTMQVWMEIWGYWI